MAQGYILIDSGYADEEYVSEFLEEYLAGFIARIETHQQEGFKPLGAPFEFRGRLWQAMFRPDYEG